VPYQQTTLRIALLTLLIGLIASWAPMAWAQDAGERVGVSVADESGGAMEAMLFYMVGGGAVVSAIGICVAKNVVRMAVWLFITLGSVAVLYFLLAANFLGAIQLIVYAGGTLILLIFGVMLTSKSPWVKFEPRSWELIGGGLVCLVLLYSLGFALYRRFSLTESGAFPGVSVADLGRALMSKYLVPFEVAGVLLFIVMVGAAHLARQEK